MKKQSERRRLGIVLSMEDFSKFRGEVEEFDQWLYSMEKTQHNHVIGDVIKVGQRYFLFSYKPFVLIISKTLSRYIVRPGADKDKDRDGLKNNGERIIK